MTMRSFEDICRIIEHRRDQDGPLINQMIEVRNRYHADYVIPIPDMDDQPELPPLTPALVANAIDAPALAAAQVQPDIFCPPLDPTKLSGVRSREYARKREHAIKATHYKSKMRLQAYRIFRHMGGYATAAMLVRPSYRLGFPIIETRDPLTAYPEPKAAEDMSRVADVGFVHHRSAGWIRQRFPHARRENGGPVGAPGTDGDELWDIVEWWDDDQTVWGLLGPQSIHSGSATEGYLNSGGRIGKELLLASYANKIGHCPAVTMPRITLDRIATQVAHNTGIIDFMGRLLMLDMIAAERNVFPDRYMVGDRGDIPRITSNNGQWADGRTGQTNLLAGVTQVGEMRSQPDPMTRAAYDTLERNYKVSTGQFGAQMGENTSNLRTGRAIAEIYGVSVDPRVMELQRIVEHGFAELNESILATWEACWPDDKVSLFAGFAANRAVDEFIPAKHVEGSHDNAVSYTIAGADVQQTTIALGQLLGTEALSLASFRRRHPWIDDPDTEEQLVSIEKIDRALFDSVLMRAQGGELPLTYLATIGEQVKQGKSITEAIAAADAEIREQQAAAPEAPEDPALGAAPEEMPGLEALGAGAPAMAAMGAAPQPPGQGAPIGPTEGQQGMAALISAMRAGGAGGGV